MLPREKAARRQRETRQVHQQGIHSAQDITKGMLTVLQCGKDREIFRVLLRSTGCGKADSWKTNIHVSLAAIWPHED